MGDRATCVAEFNKVLGPNHAEEYNFSISHSSYIQAAVDGIGWLVPDGLSALDAMAAPAAWDKDRSYYKYK